MDAVSLSNRAPLTEVIPTAPSGGEEGEGASEGRRIVKEPQTHTHKKLTQCPSQSWVVTGPWHCPGMSAMFAKPSISPPSLLKQELLFETCTC